MTTEEQLAVDRVRHELGLTALESRRQFAAPPEFGDAAGGPEGHWAHQIDQRLRELGERYIHALAQLDLEVGGIEQDDPGQTEYVRGLVAARQIIRGVR